MTKKFTPIVIAKHEQKEKDFTIATDTKKKRFNELFDYMDTFIDTQDKDVFKGQIYNVFIQRFTDKHHATYPSLSISKILDLHECHQHKLEALINAFQSIDIEWNFATNEPESIPCFDIKTEYTEQNVRYEKVNELISALDHIRADRHIYFADVVRGLNGMVAYDFSKQSIVPSISFVLGEKERATY
jgi:hypothetical protein